MSDRESIAEILKIVRSLDKKVSDVDELGEMHALADFLTTMVLIPLNAKSTPALLDERIGLALHLLGMNPDHPEHIVMRGRLLIHLENEHLRLVRAFHALGESRVRKGKERYQCECGTCDSVRAADEIVKENPGMLGDPTEHDHVVLRLYNSDGKDLDQVSGRIEATAGGLTAFAKRAYRGMDSRLDQMEDTVEMVERLGGRVIVGGVGQSSLEDTLRKLLGLELSEEPESPFKT